MAYPGLKDAKVCPKSDKKASEFRESGNNHYKQGEMMEALICYNKSICYASSKKVLSLGYANRSAVFLSLECKEECLKNIEWARENGYDNLSRLAEREEKCNKIAEYGWKNVAEDPWNFFKLSYPANKKIPWIVDCLEVRNTQKYGRGIYATKDLRAGDIISIEEPMFFLIGDGFYKHCMNCHKTCMMNLIPCVQTASMMFCSTGCMDDFYTKSIDKDKFLNDEMKFLSEVAAAFGGYKKLDVFINKTNLNELKTTIFDYDLNDSQDPNYKRNLMTCFLSLSPKNIPFVKISSPDIIKYVSEKTAKHLVGLKFMNFAENYTKTSDASSIGLFKSLMNHSCIPNVASIFIENKSATLVVSPIKAGEQLFYSYYNYISPDQELNRIATMKYYNFECECKACVDKSHQYIPIPIYDPGSYTNRKSLQLAKAVVDVGWHLINTNAQPENLTEKIQQILWTLMMIADYATFPY